MMILASALGGGFASGAHAVGAESDRSDLMSERREALRQRWEQRFREADTDNSGGLTLEEARAARLPSRLISRFDEIDTDGDGELSPEELWAAYEKQLEEQAQRPARAAGRRP